jgi:hypothetical protein
MLILTAKDAAKPIVLYRITGYLELSAAKDLCCSTLFSIFYFIHSVTVPTALV